jgi:hypothetical protein
VDVGIGSKARLWRGATLKLGLDHTYTSSDDVPSVTVTSAGFEQDLGPVNMNLKFAYISMTDPADVDVGRLNPSVTWYALSMFKDTYLALEAFYQRLAVDGPNVDTVRHGAGAKAHLKRRDGEGFSAFLGYTYFIRPETFAEPAGGFDTAEGGDVPGDTRIPGQGGHYLSTGIIYTW